MTTLINKESTQHYANKMVLAENRKVGSKSLPTTLNEIDALIDEMKTYFDAEYGSALDMKLENNKNVFSVGTGIDIDKRSEVENSFTDVQLSGNSLVNICSLNKRTKVVRNENAVFQPIMKPNTTYTLISSTSNSSFDSNKWGAIICITYPTLPPDYISLGGKAETSIIDGDKIQEFTTKAEPVKTFEFAVHSSNSITETNKYVLDYAILLEGHHTNNPPKYFQGLKSIGEKEDGNHKISISSIGKNIILDSEFKNQNGEWRHFMGEVTQGYSNNVGYTIKYSGTDDYYDVLSQKLYDCDTNQNSILPNTWYTLSFYAKGNTMRTYIYPSLINTSVKGFVNGIETTLAKDGCHAHNLTNEWTKFTYTFKTKPQIPYKNTGQLLLFRAMPNSDCVISCLMLEQGKVSTEYKPQQVDKKEISLNEPLRGLPNGVRDTIEKVNGEWKIVRRCAQIVLNGTESWNHENPSREDGVNTILFTSSKLLNAKDFPQLCDRFIPKNNNLMLQFHPDEEGIGCWSAKNNVNIRINKSRLSTVNGAGFKSWLSQNPIKVLFELATPIIEDISPITLQCWKNGVISIDDVLPVETNHTVALNKSAQIKNNIKELTTLRKRVEALESFYDKIALEQAYQLDLVNHSYELDYNK